MINVICRCGNPATRIIWFRPIVAGRRKRATPLCICNICCDKMLANEIETAKIEPPARAAQSPPKVNYAVG